jgi:uncharacterized membrane-anchored protein YitT (DUF2179 family)
MLLDSKEILINMFFFVVFILVAMGMYAFIASYLIMRVFRKYRPEMDSDEQLE